MSKQNKDTNTTPSIQSIQNLGSAAKTTVPSNEFVVITKADNLAHNYFHYCEVYWDIGDCLSQAIIRFSKSNHTNTNYWLKYEGDIWLYTGHDIHKDSKSNQEYYDLDVGEPPFFVGEVYDVQEYAYEFEVKIRSIGFRFKQSIPDEFRQAYINGQNVRDAFQAICEFLGVKYICPPQNVQLNANASLGGTEKELEQTQQKEQALATQIAQKATKELNKTETDNKNQTSDNTTENQDNNADTESVQDTPQQGYNNVSFDANGAITYNDTVIEISPDTSQTLMSMTDDAFSAYAEDDTHVIDDVKDFLNNKVFEEIHPFYLDYGSVTIPPSSTTSSDMSSMGGGAANGGSTSPADQEAITSLSSLVQKYYPASKDKNKWVNKLKECDSNWSAVATVVNQMGGDKDKQNNVIKEALKIKKEYNKKKNQEKQNKKPTYKVRDTMKAAGIPTSVNASDEQISKALNKIFRINK